jgi:hypothetical protein
LEDFVMAKLSDGKSGGNNYLKAEHLQAGKELRLTIERVEMDKIPQDDGPEQSKFVLHFRGKEKGLVLNNTNIDVLIDAYGDDTDAMSGKPIVLFRTTTQFKGQMVPCLRLRQPTEEVNEEEVVF